ncbi:hypothetical protein Q1695_002150 [Nippostrongylus brasiliensis]|nr:hypothetical protein Q1695_002150 [Nippostrongylus brasiliensis]
MSNVPAAFRQHFSADQSWRISVRRAPVPSEIWTDGWSKHTPWGKSCPGHLCAASHCCALASTGHYLYALSRRFLISSFLVCSPPMNSAIIFSLIFASAHANAIDLLDANSLEPVQPNYCNDRLDDDSYRTM